MKAQRLQEYVIGVDFGTDSVRSVLINAENGEEISSSVFYYIRWAAQQYCDPSRNQYRQHPQDYIDGLSASLLDCAKQAGPEIWSAVKAISIATTGSTPVAVNNNGTPLALLPEFSNNPNACFFLWKDHTAIKEAAEINEKASDFLPNYLKYVGGIYSTEWYWAKLLYCLRTDEEIKQSATGWVEHCDWIPFLLTGGTNLQTLKRSVCAAGHKALWSPAYNGLPPENFFKSIDPLLTNFVLNYATAVYDSEQVAGTLCEEWSAKLGLPQNVKVGVGAFDAHMGAVGGEIQPFHLSKIMGTSTCDMMVVPFEQFGDKTVAGICGQVKDSIIPGMVGLEAGQSAFGDVFAWYSNFITDAFLPLLSADLTHSPQQLQKLRQSYNQQLINSLSAQAAELTIHEDFPLAVDWLNGRRSPDADQHVKAAIIALDLGTSPAHIFYALAEATCFGAKAIVERFQREQVPVHGIIAMGGVAKKSPFIMQLMADVLQLPIRVHQSDQTCAMGAAMFAATVAGIYTSVSEAMQQMGCGFEKTYFHNPAKEKLLQDRYEKYSRLGQFLNSSN